MFGIQYKQDLVHRLTYASMQVCKYANMQVCKYASMQIFKYASIQLCNYASMQVLGRFENAKFLKIFLEHVDLAVIHKK